MTRSRASQESRIEREQKEAKGIMVLVILATMLFAIAAVVDWHEAVAPFEAFSEMAHMLFGIYIVPFEVLGFLLLAALLGALYMVTQEGERSG
jgi:NADH:ubiquinone oxidoreductase subunit 6 (subunit J)